MNVLADTNWIAGAKVQLRHEGFRKFEVVFIDELNVETVCFSGISSNSGEHWFKHFEKKLHNDWRPS